MRDHWVLSVSRRTSTILVWVTCPCTKCECSWFLCRAKYLEAHGAFRKPLEGFCRAPSSGGYSVCSGFSNALQGCTLTLCALGMCRVYLQNIAFPFLCCLLHFIFAELHKQHRIHNSPFQTNHDRMNKNRNL